MGERWERVGGGLSELACLLCLTARGNRCHGQHETRWNDRDGEKGFEAGGGGRSERFCPERVSPSESGTAVGSAPQLAVENTQAGLLRNS